MTSRSDTAFIAYINAFKALPPNPYGINDDYITEVLEKAVADGKPIPENFDWWSDLPPDAHA